MRSKQYIWAAILAGLMLMNGCASTGRREAPPDSVPQEPAQTIAIPEPEQMERPPAEEAPAPTVPSELPEEPQPDAVTSATPEPENVPEPVEPESIEISQTENTCTISINCAAILNNLDDLTEGKEDLVPPDGWLLEPLEVEFNEGESVFHVLRRICKQQNLHMEFEDTPIYNSAYIEGIGNLYEFDCGELSGWKYRVNGWFPNYGCSQYQVQSGDVIEWLYTCDLGADVGGGDFQ